MAQQSARRDQENQGFPLCFEHAVGDLDRIRELPYRPAVFERPHQQAGQMAASDYVSEIPENHSCAEGGVHRWEADVSRQAGNRPPPSSLGVMGWTPPDGIYVPE